ncbi:MAG: head GIN domain-containing protein [Pseudomonadota bacterium]
MHRKTVIGKSVTFLLLALVAQAGVISQAMAGDDKRVEKRITEGSFTRIEVSGVYDLSVNHGSDHSVILSGREKAIAHARVVIRDDTLFLGHQKGRHFRNKKSVDAVITLPQLREITVSGVVDGSIRDVDTDDFTIRVSGVGDLRVDGKCKQLRADLSGVGDLDARDLKCDAVKVTVSGVGDARVYAENELDAHVSGIGDLTCFGSPKRVRKNKSFFSTISVH